MPSQSVSTRAYKRRQVVETLDVETLDRECARLYQSVVAGGIVPTHIIGIASAGNFVAGAMALQSGPDVVIMSITARRSTSKWKRRIAPALRLVPVKISTPLRRLENRLITRHLSTRREVLFDGEQEASLKASREIPLSLLVVDDCVDTGGSLLAVVEYLRRIVGSEVSIQTAALAMSIETPLMQPDFCHHENSQFRGPWSLDLR